ncbi:MAG TPA: hypothetical protein VH134_02485 [Candidatus Dormibacteraeota bacterium]|nr:hypothetical protein [Candidatus Dormibacteraeota bacterium]
MTTADPPPQAESHPPPVVLPAGTVAMRMLLFESPDRELARVVRSPWPSWMRQLYALEHLALHTHDPGEQIATLGASVTALAERLHYRLGVVAFVVTAMEEIWWRADLDERGILMTKRSSPQDAVDELERAGIYGPMCKVCLLDETGLPWIAST